MGLDIVEFVLDVEKTFSITIPNEEAARLRTPGELVSWLEANLKSSRVGACPSQLVFHRLRGAIRTTLAPSEARLRPATRWDTFLPAEGRSQLWQRIGLEGSLRLPGLERSPAVYRSLLLVAAVSTLSLFLLFLWLDMNAAWALLASIPSTLIVCAVLSAATQRFAWRIPKGFETLGDSARYALAHDSALETGPTDFQWSRAEISAVVRSLVIWHFDVTDFTEDSSFVNDMGAD